MTDSTDDYRFSADFNTQALIDDCKLLGSLLDDALKQEVGEDLFLKVNARAIGRTLVELLGIQGDRPSAALSALRAQVEKIRSLAKCAAELANKGDAVRCRLSPR